MQARDLLHKFPKAVALATQSQLREVELERDRFRAAFEAASAEVLEARAGLFGRDVFVAVGQQWLQAPIVVGVHLELDDAVQAGADWERDRDGDPAVQVLRAAIQ